MYDELIGKYLNGYKIVRVEKDPFIKEQINLWTDEETIGTFGDRNIVKFFIREESNSAKIYQELVDKEKHELQIRIEKAIKSIEKNYTYLSYHNNVDIDEVLNILRGGINDKWCK